MKAMGGGGGGPKMARGGGGGPKAARYGGDPGSHMEAETAASSTAIVLGSQNTTIATALRSATMTVTASVIVTGYLGTASGSGFTVPVTHTTIAGGCAVRP